MKIKITILGMILLAGCSETPEQHEKAVARLTISNCWEDQSKKSLEPETARFMASVCEKMESDFTAKYGVKP